MSFWCELYLLVGTVTVVFPWPDGETLFLSLLPVWLEEPVDTGDSAMSSLVFSQFQASTRTAVVDVSCTLVTGNGQKTAFLQSRDG